MYKILQSFLIILIIFLFLLSCNRTETCPSCSGKGKVVCSKCIGDKKYINKIDCSHCRNGKIQCDECEGNGTMDCRFCEGHGMEFSTCFGCGGSGMDFIYNERNTSCKICGGSGNRYAICHNCNGDGRIECEFCDNIGWVDCKFCKGSGQNEKDEECYDCDENGLIKCSKCNGKGEIVL